MVGRPGRSRAIDERRQYGVALSGVVTGSKWRSRCTRFNGCDKYTLFVISQSAEIIAAGKRSRISIENPPHVPERAEGQKVNVKKE